MIFFKDFDNYINEAYESRGLEDILRNKANSLKDRGITYNMLRIIYSRGIEDFSEKKKKGSSKNYAMKRVDDFLARGKSWSIYDTDMSNQAKRRRKKLLKKKKKK